MTMERTTDDGRRTDRRWQASHIPSLRRPSKNKFDFETEKLEHQRQVLNHYPRAAVHRNAAIFEIDRNFDHILLAYEFQDDISNSSRVIVLTNTHTHTHTHLYVPTIHCGENPCVLVGRCGERTHKLTLLKTISPRYASAARVVTRRLLSSS